jgi:hypothetical protein
VWSVSRIHGTLSAAMGLIFGALLALFSIVGAGWQAMTGSLRSLARCSGSAPWSSCRSSTVFSA